MVESSEASRVESSEGRLVVRCPCLPDAYALSRLLMRPSTRCRSSPNSTRPALRSDGNGGHRRHHAPRGGPCAGSPQPSSRALRSCAAVEGYQRERPPPEPQRAPGAVPRRRRDRHAVPAGAGVPPPGRLPPPHIGGRAGDGPRPGLAGGSPRDARALRGERGQRQRPATRAHDGEGHSSRLHRRVR